MRYLQDIYKASKPVEGAEEWDEVGKERSQTSPRIWSTSREALKHMWPFTLAPLLAKAPRLLYSQDDQSLHVGFFMKNMHVKEFAAVDAHSKGPESLFAEYMPSNTHFYVHTHTHTRAHALLSSDYWVGLVTISQKQWAHLNTILHKESRVSWNTDCERQSNSGRNLEDLRGLIFK